MNNKPCTPKASDTPPPAEAADREVISAPRAAPTEDVAKQLVDALESVIGRLNGAIADAESRRESLTALRNLVNSNPELAITISPSLRALGAFSVLI